MRRGRELEREAGPERGGRGSSLEELEEGRRDAFCLICAIDFRLLSIPSLLQITPLAPDDPSRERI